jgi:hypothetical protein
VQADEFRHFKPAISTESYGNSGLELVTAHDLGPFDVGAAHEALARCYRIIGDAGKTAEHVALSREQSASIADADDRAILDSDLASLA